LSQATPILAGVSCLLILVFFVALFEIDCGIAWLLQEGIGRVCSSDWFSTAFVSSMKEESHCLSNGRSYFWKMGVTPRANLARNAL
jgi:hypothetical protein